MPNKGEGGCCPDGAVEAEGVGLAPEPVPPCCIGVWGLGVGNRFLGFGVEHSLLSVW